MICVDVNSIGNESTVKQIRIDGGQAYAYTCDVTSRDNVQRTVQSIEREISPITMVFHCCGVPSPRTYTTNSPPAIQDTINVSIMSHFWVGQEMICYPLLLINIQSLFITVNRRRPAPHEATELRAHSNADLSGRQYWD